MSLRAIDMECGCEGFIDVPGGKLDDVSEVDCPTHGATRRRIGSQVRPWRGVNKKDRWADITGQ